MGFAFEFPCSLDALVLRLDVQPVRLDVVGEHGPAGRGALPLAAFEAAAPEPVAAFRVRDAALGADAVASEPSPRAFRGRRGSPRDVDPLRGERGERLAARLP